MKERTAEILRLYNEGQSFRQIGDVYGVSRQRIEQIVNEVALKTPRRSRDPVMREADARQAVFRDRLAKYSDRHRRFFSKKKTHAKRSKWGFDVRLEDLEYPDVCPVLGIPLDWDCPKRTENSPSLDRLDSSKGYVKGNVVVMSWRANRIKNNGTAEEHAKIADFMTRITT